MCNFKSKTDDCERNLSPMILKGNQMVRLDFRRFLESGLRSPREGTSGVSAGSFPEQRLVIEPIKWYTREIRK